MEIVFLWFRERSTEQVQNIEGGGEYFEVREV